MKTKKFLLIALLSGALMLSSCDFFTQSKKSSKDDNDDDTQQTGDNFEENDYKGKSGATQLSESEWNKAFSLEETALHRSVKVNMLSEQKQQQYTMGMVAEIDHGKFKLTESYNTESYTFYIGVNAVSNNIATYTMYYPEDNGYRASETDSGPVDLLMSEIGILNYRYQDFTYDSGSKTYKSDAFTINMSSYVDAGEYSSSSYCVTNATIAIKDGFPSKIELDVDTGESSVHFVANYSDYGKVVVTLPEQGGANNPSDLGNEISYDQFINAFNKRPESPYNHADININKGSIKASATYLYGVWETDSEQLTSSFYESLTLNDNTIASLQAESASIHLKYYYNASNNTYSYSYSGDVSDMDVSTTMTYNEYFLLVSQESIIYGNPYNIHVTWSNVPVPDYINVAGSTFIGVDLEEKTNAYYEGYKATTQGMTIDFDRDGHVKMIITVINSGNEVQDTYLAYYGTYTQNGNSVSVMINVANNGSQVSVAPEGQELRYDFEIIKGQLIMHMSAYDGEGEVVLHLIFDYSTPYSGEIEIPSVDDNGNSNNNGNGNTSIDVSGLGTQITYDQLMAAYNQRPQAQYNHFAGTLIYGSTTYNLVADLKDGEWESSGDMPMDPSGLIITQDTLVSLNDTSSMPEGAIISFYKNTNNEYSIVLESSDINEIITMNAYFYVIYEYMVSGDTVMTLNARWSNAN